MQLGATQILYEGAPNWPEPDRLWQIVEEEGVTIFYTAPTAIRSFMKWGDRWPKRHSLSSLRLLGTVGEPINPEAWLWYHEVIGGRRCPIMDTWWQTETGAISITPLPGASTTKPGSATFPFYGIDAAILDDEGNEITQGGGLLALRKPWPSMMRGIWGDNDRYRSTYFNRWDGKYYFTGDGAARDEEGYFWIVGRVDDVVNISGHRIGTSELESLFVEHPAVTEAAVIGVKHEIKGQALVGFVTLRDGFTPSDALADELRDWIGLKIGSFAKPERVLFAADLPKTRSGKIMRRLLRDIAEGRALGDVTALTDPGAVAQIKERYEEEG
jgi:acetyl-CoA synthetase